MSPFSDHFWNGYKTGDGIEPALWAQFWPLEDALRALGVAVWAMEELEADDALASAARIAGDDPQVQQVCIWTPDKDLAQCVRGDRIRQVDRKTNVIRGEEGVRAKFGVVPERIPDYLALVGDRADGYPGIDGIGPNAASLIGRYGRSRISLSRRSASAASWRCSSRSWRPCGRMPASSRKWRRPGKGPTSGFADWAGRLAAPKLLERAQAAARYSPSPSGLATTTT